MHIWGRHPKLSGDLLRWSIVRLTFAEHQRLGCGETLEDIARDYRTAYPEQEFTVSATRPQIGESK
jgi:hypothetical protein